MTGGLTCIDHRKRFQGLKNLGQTGFQSTAVPWCPPHSFLTEGALCIPLHAKPVAGIFSKASFPGECWKSHQDLPASKIRRRAYWRYRVPTTHSLRSHNASWSASGDQIPLAELYFVSAPRVTGNDGIGSHWTRESQTTLEDWNGSMLTLSLSTSLW